MYWVKAAWIDPLFSAFNRKFPDRAKDSDGTIGDAAHMTGVSGHNPDDTPGVQAERQDADTIPEVRAADVTSTLRDPGGLTMEDAVQAILHGPAAELARLIYIIYNRRIWRAGNGWREEPYSGTDPHENHAHFSGHPDADDNGAPWTSIEDLGRPPAREDENDMERIPVELSGFTSIPLPPVEGGAWPRQAFLNVSNDTNGDPYALRIWWSKGKPGEWFPLTDWGPDGIRRVASGEQVAVKLPAGLTCLTVSRSNPYAGPLAVTVERGPIQAK